MADPGGIIVSADYSQLELRTAAVLANEDFLLDVYARGADLHDEMAVFLFKKSFTQEQRVAAKGANFGCLFGIQGWYFGRLFGMSTEEGQRVIDRWWARVPSLAKWRDETQAFGRANGYVRTAFGHKRRFPLITNENREHVLREMVNTPVQGTASDFTTCSIIDLDRELPNFRDHVVLAVHDATVAIAQKSNAKKVCDTIKEVMEAQPKLRLGWDQIPFTVDIKTGPDWGHVK
jgi:DNA polymerase-1